MKMLCIILSAVMFAFTVCSCKKTTEDNGEENNNGEQTVEYENEYLLKGGKSDYKVILPANASDAEKYAAKELNRIFVGTGGIALPVVSDAETIGGNYISIGNTKQAAAANVTGADTGVGGYELKTSGGNLYIHSATESGKINGVYAFAEKNLGYMYYAEDEIKYTESENVRLMKFSETKKPSFDGRNVHSYETVYNHENAVRLKCNGITTNWISSYGEASLWASLHDMSNVFQLLYVKDYYPEHPDWFCLSDEYADKGDTFAAMSDDDFYKIAQKHSQICYTKGYYDNTSGGMFDTYVNNLIEYIKNEPDRELFMLGMGDNKLVCNCENCQRDIELYKTSGVVMRFTNRVARKIKDWLKNESGTPERKVYLVVFAYLTAMEPPVKYVERKPVPLDDSVVAEDNVMIRIAPLVDSNFYWRIDDTDHNTFMANNINGWKQISSNFSIWDYRVYYHYLFAPYPTWNTVKSNLEVYKNLNVIDIFHQGYSETPVPFGKLDDYVRARLLFDLNEDENALTEDFIENYYKEGAFYIKEYRDFLKYYYETVLVPKRYSGSVYTDIIDKKCWDIESLLHIRDIFEKAYKSILDLQEERYLVVKERLDEESRFYRYALIELYGERFSSQELSKMIEEFKAANSAHAFTYHAVREPLNEKIAAWEKLLK